MIYGSCQSNITSSYDLGVFMRLVSAFIFLILLMFSLYATAADVQPYKRKSVESAQPYKRGKSAISRQPAHRTPNNIPPFKKPPPNQTNNPFGRPSWGKPEVIKTPAPEEPE